MGEEFGQNKKKRDNSECDLHSLSPQPPTRNGLSPPLSREPVPERSNSPDHVQIEAGAKNSKHHHGNAYCILVKAGCWSLCSRGNCDESSKSEDQPNAAERHGEGTDALQDDEKKGRQTDSPSADASVARMLMCLRSLRADLYALSSHMGLTFNSHREIQKNFILNAIVRHNENVSVATSDRLGGMHRRCKGAKKDAIAKIPGTDFNMLLTPLGENPGAQEPLCAG